METPTVDKKFYVPQIEEFHVGFRYEGRFGSKQPYFKTEVDDLESLHLIEKSLAHKRLRVKYLDREDIEELGWVLQKDNKNDKLIKYSHGEGIPFYNMWYNKESGKYSIDWVTAEPFMFMTEFRGKIKNYNELKKVMQMLGV